MYSATNESSLLFQLSKQVTFANTAKPPHAVSTQNLKYIQRQGVTEKKMKENYWIEVN